MADKETELLVSKIDDVATNLHLRIDDLKFTISQFETNLNREIKEAKDSTTALNKKVDLYVTNHYKSHQKITKTHFKLILALAIVGVVASVCNPYLLPIILKAIFGVII